MKQLKNFLHWCKCIPMLCVAAFFAPQSANAEIQAVDGVYQLGTAQDLVDFATLVNGGETAANAVLTADIDMTGATFAPIGNANAKYNGKFDGQNHVISNLVIDLPNQDYVGVFGMITAGAEIKHFTVDNTCSFTGKAFVAVIGGSNECGGGTVIIDGIGCEATITGSAQNVAGIYGVNMGSSAVPLISNCYVTGKVTGARESGAITGWAQKGTITNCYSIAEVTGADGADKDFHRGNPTTINCYTLNGVQGTKVIAEEDLTSGKLAFLLNGKQDDIHFVQTLGKGDYPTLTGGKQVYFWCCDGIDCLGNPKGEHFRYSNDPKDATAIDDHNFVEGACDVCALIKEDGFQPNEDGVYEISTPQGLYYFATMVSAKKDTYKARLTADIDYTAFNKMIGGRGNEENFYGEFDGQGHTVTINMTKPNSSNYNECSLFGGINGGTVKNLIIDGTINSNDKFAAAVVGRTWGNTTIENVISNVKIISTKAGDATNGGIVGVVAGGQTTIKNVLVAGSQESEVGTECCGGIVGWTEGGGSTVAENVLIIADLAVSANGSDITSRNNGRFTGKNIFYATSFQGEGANYSKATETNEEEMACGKMAVALGWGQELGKDAVPSPLSDKYVYKYGSEYTNTYNAALTMPVLSTPENPVFYYIKNVRRNQYVTYTGAQMTQAAEATGYENMFYFVAAGEAEGNIVPVHIYNAVAGGKAMKDFFNWGDATTWNILTNTDTSNRGSKDGLFIGTSTNPGDNAWWNDHSGQFVGSWSCDAGSVWTFEAVAIEEVPEMAVVTYNHVNNGKVLKSEKGAFIVGEPYVAPATPVYVSAATPEGVVDGDATIDIEVEINTPFVASTDFENASWYRLLGHIDGPKYLNCTDGQMQTGEDSYEDNYLWSFYGNPYEGYKIMNRATGDSLYMHVDNPANGVTPTMSNEATVWSIDRRDDNVFGFATNGFFLNRHGGVSYTIMKLWQNGPAGDKGSTLWVEGIYKTQDVTPNQLATRNDLTILSTASELVLATYTSDMKVADETAKVLVNDYFAGVTYEIAPVFEGNNIKIVLPKTFASSTFLYVTIPAGMLQMYGETLTEDITLRYYVHGSEFITEETISKVLNMIGGETAIEGVIAGQGSVDVYSINGAVVKKAADASALKNLKGIYIVNGKKVVLK